MVITSYTLIDTFPFEVVVFATKRWFGAFSPGNLELLRGKHPAPFFITPYNFISHIQLLLLGRLGGVFCQCNWKMFSDKTPGPHRESQKQSKDAKLLQEKPAARPSI